ncbi:MAG: GNAT family protein [Acidobacteriaceae bacterium]
MNIREHSPISPTQILRPATSEDIPRIMALERIPEFHTMVGVWSEQEHLAAFHDPDIRYFVVSENIGEAVGFAILRGISSPHRNLELKRFVIATPGEGLGRRALAALLAHVFEKLGAHRLWLDVFETNARAVHVYQKTGFRQDGVFREAIYRDGEFHTLLLMSILDREYAQISPAR